MKSLPGKLSSKDKKQYTVPTSIQAVFTISVIVTFLFQMTYIAYLTLQQPAGQPLAETYSYFASQQGVPILLFLIAYALNPRKLSKLPRSFESLLFTVAALTIWTAFLYVDPALFIGNPADNYMGSYMIYQLVSSAVMVVLYSGVLYWLRRSKHWA